MMIAKTFTLLFLQLICINLHSFPGDSLLFIDEVKKFTFKTIGFELKGNFYTKWSAENKPYVNLYVSLGDKIQKPEEFKTMFISCGTDEKQAAQKELVYKEKGYHTFRYKTYANASAVLNKRFLSYPKEAITFIVLHEAIHNYLIQQRVKIPYEFNEALSDVVANYGTLEYAKVNKTIDLKATKHQIKSNEKLYRNFNRIILKIKEKPGKTSILNAQCDKKLQVILKNMNSFQKDRFDYQVNNAYLLKNLSYCKNYFLLKKVLHKQKSIIVLLEIIKDLPEKAEDCEKYLEQFS